MSYYAISAGLNCISSLVLALFFLQNRTKYYYFVLFNLGVSFWSLNYFLWQLSQTELDALFYIRLLMVGASFIPFLFTGFTLQYYNKPHLGALNYVNALLSVVFSFSMWSPLMITRIESVFSFPFWPKAGLLFPLFMLYFVGNVIFSFVLMYQKYRRYKNRNDLILLVATCLAFSGGSTNFLLWFDIPIVPFGNGWIVLYVLIMSVAILRKGILDIDFLISRGLPHVALFGLIFLAYASYEFKFIPFIDPFYTPSFKQLFFNVLFFMSVLLIYPRIKETFSDFSKHLFLKNKLFFNQLKKELLTLTEGVNSIHVFGQEIERFLISHTATVKVDVFVSKTFTTRHADFHEYSCISGSDTSAQLMFNSHHPLIQTLKETKYPITYLDAPPDIQELLEMMQAKVVIPCLSTTSLEGFLVLYTASAPMPYSFEEIQLFEFMVISFPRLFERLKDYATLEDQVAFQTVELQQKKMMEKDLLRAKEVQKKLLPAFLPAPKQFTFDAVFKPARIVSGDYYDFFSEDGEKYGVILVDIVGKGMSAAFIMMYFKSVVQDLFPPKDTLQKTMEYLNRLVFHNPIFDKYIPMIYMELDPKTMTLTYVNAGHEDALLFSGTAMIPLPSCAAPLGLDMSEVYEAQTIPLHPKDIVILFTDGLTDAINTEKTSYGVDRLIKRVQAYQNHKGNRFSPAQYIDEDLTVFTKEVQHQKDDVTIVSIEVNGVPSKL